MVPPNWPVNMMSSFLSRSFRRTLHSQQEGKIVKNISAGQNLEVCAPHMSPASPFFLITSTPYYDMTFDTFHQVKDRTWDVLREEGAVIEEEAEDDEGSDEDEGPQSFDEKKVLAEQVAMHLVPGLDPSVVKTAVHNPTSRGMGAEDLR